MPRSRAAHRTYAAIERKLAEENEPVERLAKERALAAQDAERHGQIESRAFLADVGRGEVDGDALRRGEIEAAVLQCRLDALAAFLDGNVRQAHHVKIAQAARADVHLDFDEVGINAVNGGAQALEKHGTREANGFAVERLTQNISQGQRKPASRVAHRFLRKYFCVLRVW